MNELTETILSYAADCVNSPESPPRDASFQRLVLAAMRLSPRFEKALERVAAGSKLLTIFGPMSEVLSFLKRTSFYDRLPVFVEQAREIAEALTAELNRPSCSVTSLVLLDGLELPAAEIQFTGGRLVELTEDFIKTWFDGRIPPGAVPASRLVGVAGLEVVGAMPTPPWGPGIITWESDAKQTRRTGWPWMIYLNLCNEGKCRQTGMYQRSDSLLHEDTWRAVGVVEPMWETRLASDGVDDYEYEALYATLRPPDAAHLVDFLATLEAGRIAAGKLTHRVDTALRFFDRVSGTFMPHHLLGLGDDIDANEDLIVDAVAGLEAIFIGDEGRGKGQRIGRRASALLESEVDAQRLMRKQAVSLYELRSAILHGDARAPSELLREHERIAERLLRSSVLALCRLNGDHSRIVKAETDAAYAADIRRQLAATSKDGSTAPAPM